MAGKSGKPRKFVKVPSDLKKIKGPGACYWYQSGPGWYQNAETRKALLKKRVK